MLEPIGTIVERTMIPHRAFIDAQKRLDRLCRLRCEAEALALIGEPGTGKTTVLHNHVMRYPPSPTPEGRYIPVLLTSVPSDPSLKKLAEKMLEDMGFKDPRTRTEAETTRRLITLITTVRMKMVMIDEFHHFVDQRTGRVTRYIADWLKDLIDKTRVTVVIAGLPTCLPIIDQNAQFARSFSAPVVMPRFNWDNDHDRKEFLSILRGFHARLGEVYDCPDLSTEETALRIYMATGGLMGHLIRLLREVERGCASGNLHKIFEPTQPEDAG